MLLDARQGIAEQDAHLLGHTLERGRALVIAVNKWDRLESGLRQRIRTELDRKLHFVNFARLHFISALHGSGIIELLDSVKEAYDAATRKLSTPELTCILKTLWPATSRRWYTAIASSCAMPTRAARTHL